MKLYETVVKKWYDALEEGKLVGFKCKRCNAYEFPPVYCCNNCSSTDMEWSEISGNGKMIDFVLPNAMTAKPYNDHLMPYCMGSVELEEGPFFSALVCGVSKKNKQEMNKKLPIPVKMEIEQRDGFKTVIFRIVEQDVSPSK